MLATKPNVTIKLEKLFGNAKEVEQAFGIPVNTLRQMRYEGKGPKYYKPGRVALYNFEEVSEWIKYHSVHTGDSIRMERGE